MLPSSQDIRYLRKKAGLTQEELARRSGLSQGLISRIEKGKIDTRLSTLRKLLEVIKASEVKKKPSLNIRDYMTSPVIYCRASDSIKKVILLMESNGISQMPVMDGGKQVGSVTDTKLVQILSRWRHNCSRKRISDAMAKPFPELDLNTPIDRAIGLLTKSPAVLVMDGSHVAGILTKADILKLML